MASLDSNTKYESIVFCFQKHSLFRIQWLPTLLNTFYKKKIPVAKYDNLLTFNALNNLKVDALSQIDEWILDEAQMVSAHGAGATEARAMIELLKIEKSPLAGLYQSGDYEVLEDTDDLIHYMNHVYTSESCHNSFRTPLHDRKMLVIYKVILTLFPIHKNITSKY